MDFDYLNNQVANYVENDVHQADVIAMVVGRTLSMEKKIDSLNSEVKSSSQANRDISVRANF